jgi:exopolyphosphatase / guanosine-5'-triphosphate,3'-diphosphate pyrophosphatase
MLNPTPETLLAAVDLGSNSFRLEISRFVQGQIQPVVYLKEPVRQGGDLDADRNLNPAAIERGLKCLARFGESLKGFPKQHVRAVATQTLREARNRDEFLTLARKALGYNIEVISGAEEARLIYQGVSRYLPQSDERRLVIDIGGRSTEFILGQHFTAQTTDSLRVGSVAWSLKYFPNGDLSEKNFDRAVIAAESFLDVITESFGKKNWDIAYGASGTVGAIADILFYQGYRENYVNRKGLEWLRNELIYAKSADRLRLNGLKDDRKPVIAGGLSVLLAIFDLLEMDEIHVAKGSLRHGLIFDMVAEDTDEITDVREASVKALANRFQANTTHASNVKETALYFFDRIVDYLQQPKQKFEISRKVLGWAAQLHEIGMMISHTEAHRHGAYILDHSELMGFSQTELHRLSLLVLGQHGKIKKLEGDFTDTNFVIQLVCLRLAVILCHSRRKPLYKGLSLQLHSNLIQLNTSQEWLLKFPQTAYLLEEEVIAWQKINWNLIITITNA